MSETTNISWCDSTWSPWLGCRKVSPGCAHCYITGTTPFRTRKLKHGDPRQRTSASYWKQPVKWDRDFAAWRDQPCAPHLRPAVDEHAKRIRPRIFPSLCDWLDDEVPIEWLADFLKLIHDTPNLDWLLLTKRPENFQGRIKLVSSIAEFPLRQCQDWLDGNPPHNVWLGVSVEDQKRADERIPLLLQIPAKVRFLSVEPLLECVDLSRWLNLERRSHQNRLGDPWIDDGWHPAQEPKLFKRERLDWIICGGESGKERRDCGAEAICDLARQCVAAGVPCFVKQSSAFKPGQQGDLPEAIWSLKQFPKL